MPNPMLYGIKRMIRKSYISSLFLGPDQGYQPRDTALAERNAKYDQQTVEVMRQLLQPDSCCIDVGAHKGSILEEMVKISPLGTHFAFEPLPQFAAYLKKKFPNVRIHEAAVADYTGRANFVYVENSPAYSGLRRRIYDRPGRMLKPITVNVVRIDDVILAEQNVKFIKLDIEGGEFHALRGSARLIRLCRPIVVCEAGVKSTGQYGVTPEEFYNQFCEGFGYYLSTMQRWLDGQAPYTADEFCDNWHNGPDYYFIGYPVE